MKTILLNQFGANSVWFACVLGGAGGLPWLGVAASAAWLGFHVPRSDRPRRELTLVATAAALGAVVDVAFVRGEFLSYASPGPFDGFGPVWIVALWAGFATTLNVSLQWLQDRPALAALMGGIFGPLAYVAGGKLGGVTFASDQTASLLAVSAAWAIAMPLLTTAARKLHRSEPAPSPN